MALVPTVLALFALAMLLMASVASATPVEGPEGPAFYEAPETLEGKSGELLRYRKATLNLNVTLPSYKAWTVMYQSSNQQNNPVATTGTVVVPTAAWTGKGPRPVVTVGIGTQGLSEECAPSKQMIAGTEYDGGEVIAALKAGYAVAITDYEGYTTGVTPTYLDGKAEAQAVLDIARATREVPESGVTESNPVIAWGYSQGGQAVSWAGELQPTYAPDVKLVGVATGGTPGYLQAVAGFGNESVAAGFALDSLIGLNAAYPGEFGLLLIVNAEGFKVGIKLKEMCAIQSLKTFLDTKFETLTEGGKTLEQIETEHPTVKRIVEEQNLGTKPVNVPVYHYHGLEDEFVPVTQDVELHNAWCKLGVTDDFQLYPGDHLLTDPTAIPTVLKWIEERFAGKAAPSTCGQHAEGAKLPATARLTPEKGDFIIPLPFWQLKGSVTENSSGIQIEVPKGATLNAHGDLTSEVVEAELSIPPINQTIKVLGLPLTVKGSLTPTEKVFHGKVSLTNSGVLSQTTEGFANMKVASAGIGFFQIPVGCTTKSPIALPLSVSEPTNALETGGFAIETKVTVPEFGGCGIFGPILSSLMSGPNNTIKLTASPPPPINW